MDCEIKAQQDKPKYKQRGHSEDQNEPRKSVYVKYAPHKEQDVFDARGNKIGIFDQKGNKLESNDAPIGGEGLVNPRQSLSHIRNNAFDAHGNKI